jgi:hypothetical protein
MDVSSRAGIKMNEKEIIGSNEDALAVKPIPSVGEPAVKSRRRLFRQGASVVAVTLASRPVLAWHCKTTSAWGSELINPNTSLKTDSAHPLSADEGWYVSDWANNSNSNSALGGVGKPWDTLLAKCPTLKDKTTTSNGKANGTFDYTKVTLSKLVATLNYYGFVLKIPSGASGDNIAKTVFSYGSNDFRAATLTAQLNFILLSPKASPFDQEKCTNLTQLNTMASGSYQPANSSKVWSKSEIVTYLYQNWIIR